MKISVKKYTSIHDWIKNHHGKATHCTNKDCKGKSKNYNWCLIKGKKYEKKIENFIQMCRSCHGFYDTTEETRIKARQHSKNTHKTHCKRGHEFTKENTRITENTMGNGSINKGRSCRKCSNYRTQLWRKKNPQFIKELNKIYLKRFYEKKNETL